MEDLPSNNAKDIAVLVLRVQRIEDDNKKILLYLEEIRHAQIQKSFLMKIIRSSLATGVAVATIASGIAVFFNDLYNFISGTSK